MSSVHEPMPRLASICATVRMCFLIIYSRKVFLHFIFPNTVEFLTINELCDHQGYDGGMSEAGSIFRIELDQILQLQR